MALDDHIRILSGVRLFEGFAQDQLRLLAFGAEAMSVSAGKKLYREHEGDRVEVSTGGPGTVLGEMALIADSRRLTSADAETDAEVLRINRSMFRRILEEYPETAERLRTQIIEDLQALIRRIEEVGERLG